MFENFEAMERIAFQHDSQFRTKLVAICDQYLTWIATTRPISIDGTVPLATPRRINETVKYGRSTIVPLLQNLFYDTFQLRIKVNLYGDPVFNCAVTPMFRNIDWERTILHTQLYSGTLAHDKVNIDPKLLESLETTIDLEKSRFVELPNSYLMILHLFAAPFLGEELIGGVIPWTAEEQAAIITHECGHAFAGFEHMVDLYHRADVAGNSVKYLATQTMPTKAQVVVDQLKQTARTEPNTPWAREFDKASSQLTGDYSKSRGFVVGIAGMVLRYTVTKMMALVVRFVYAGYFGAVNNNADKSSDTVVTQSNMGYNERIADEFVARHGLATAMASALIKMNSNAVYLRDPVGDAIRQVAWQQAISDVITSISHFYGMLFFCDDGEYDPLWLRLEHMLQNQLVVFKDETLSPEIRAYFIGETQTLMKSIAAIKNSNSFKIRQLFWGTILRILSRDSIIDGIRTANLSADYDILQQMTNGLVKNPLAYHAARLQQLL